ncbi:MAG: purine-binding chemotaxis protein CheW [Campylobacterales bacterium]|nr:purine-binding chemotaxis protein CheW [Campylobacterales bacterium]
MSISVETNSFMIFRVKNQNYAVELTKIREILTYKGVTEIPDSKDYILGVINLRGQATPIIDLRIRFKSKDDIKYNDKTVILAVKVKNDKSIGYIVDEIKGIESADIGQLVEASDGDTIDNRYIKGYIKKGEDMIILVDSEHILDVHEVSKLLSK